MAIKFNENLKYLETDDSFYKATQKIKEYTLTHPNAHVVSLGIGDVSLPVSRYIADKMIAAINRETTIDYVGYGNYYGIPELRKAIRDNEYPNFDVEEIYVSQGTKTDAGDILEMLSPDVVVAIPTPTYPIFENACIALNKKYELIPSDDEFIPLVPNKHFDVIYLCSPNNPTGVCYSYDQLKKWVDYAIKENALIIFDNVYNRFITNGVKSIYEIEGAKKCAIEMRSFSKHLSFTGIRCSYYVVPNELNENVNKFWRYRTINRFNGASYIAQVGALASFDEEAKKDIEANVAYYKKNIAYLRSSFIALGYEVYGGENAPYLWVKIKNNLTSWELFDLFLNKLEVVVVPGAIFGKKGDQYFRVSALGKYENAVVAMERIKQYEQQIKEN